MDESLKLRWQLYFEKYPTEKILKGNNLLRDYEDEMIDGPIIDLGCGQSSFLLDFINTNKEIYAIDNEQFQLDLLRDRILASSNSIPENWHFIELDINKQDIPENVYSLVICSNIFQFFNLSKGKEVGQSIANKTTTGSLIYLQVHSTKHPSYNSRKKSGFTHFFTLEDIDAIFNNEVFERIYTADIQSSGTKENTEFTNFWLDKWYEKNGITDLEEITNRKDDYLKNNLHAYFTIILRRR